MEECGFDCLGTDEEIGVNWGDVGRGAAGAGHLTGKTLLNLFAGGAGAQQLEELQQSQGILPSWAESPPSFSYASPDFAGVVFKDGRQESFKAPTKIEGWGGKILPGNGYVKGDDLGKKFTAALEAPAKIVIDDKTLLDVAVVFVHGGTSQVQTKVGYHADGFDMLGAEFDYMNLLKGVAGIASGAGGMMSAQNAQKGGTPAAAGTPITSILPTGTSATADAERLRLQAAQLQAESSARTWKIVGGIALGILGLGAFALFLRPAAPAKVT